MDTTRIYYIGVSTQIRGMGWVSRHVPIRSGCSAGPGSLRLGSGVTKGFPSSISPGEGSTVSMGVADVFLLGTTRWNSLPCVLTEVLSPLCAISSFNCEQVKPLTFPLLPVKLSGQKWKHPVSAGVV